MRFLYIILMTACVAACASGARQPANPEVALTVDPTALQSSDAGSMGGDYRIGPQDQLSLRVFQVADLSFNEIFVDAAGNLQVPLVGSVRASGLTPAELSRDIEQRLSQRFLRDPQVTITVTRAASQKITVDGAVAKPGVYEMRGRTTLMQAVAMAEGTSNVAELDSVAIFRTVDGRRMVAVFDLGAIRGGQAADPVLAGDDVVIIDTSRLNANLRDFLQALPGLAVFAYL